MNQPTAKTTRKKSRSVIFRLTDEEYSRLEIEAGKIGLTVNELARSFARTPKGRITVNVTQQMNPAYIAQLKRIGNNLNQMTKNANIFGRPSENLENICHEIRSIIICAAEETCQ